MKKITIKVGDFTITNDPYCFVVHVTRIKKDSKTTKPENVGKPYEALVGFYANFKDALLAILRRSISEDVATSLQEVVDAIEKAEAKIFEAIVLSKKEK